MKYIKKYEELDIKKALVGTALAAGMMASSCKKEDIVPNTPTPIETTKDSTEVDEPKDSTKTLKKISDIVNKVTSNKTESKPLPKQKKNRVLKFKDYLRSKFKKRN